MKQRTEATQELPNYLYTVLPDGMASVFVTKFIETETRLNEEGEEYTVYIYETNEFIADPEVITEEMISDNPEDYLDYTIENISLEERTTALEDAVYEIAEVIFNG